MQRKRLPKKRACEPKHPDPTKNPQCPLCRLWVGAQTSGLQVYDRCIYRGEPTGETAIKLNCTADPPKRIPLFGCDVHGTCTTAEVARGEFCCRHCTHRSSTPPSAFVARPDDPPVGVAIGSYQFPGLVELQIKLIRHHCGDVPILVSDDVSAYRDGLAKMCDQAGVFLWPNPTRLGHTGGDLAAFWKGILWGKSHGLRVVAKLSQRFLVDTPRWLQDGAIDLLRSGLPLSSRRCTGGHNFPLRTEACLLDVDAWHRPDVLQVLAPRERPKPENAEWDFDRLLKAKLGGLFWPWKLFSEDRFAKQAGFLWHNANTKAEYQSLARRFGVQLDASFHVDGWQNDPKYVH